MINGKRVHDLLPSIYHHLQFAYYQGECLRARTTLLPSAVEQVQRACAAVGAYLLFVPDDADMMYNKQYYTSTHPQLADDAFTPELVSVDGVLMCM
jgi:leucine proline-enriched proteoglycan (leprecan)